MCGIVQLTHEVAEFISDRAHLHEVDQPLQGALGQ